MGFWKNVSTGQDNETYDVARVLAIASVVVGLGLCIYAVGWKDQIFDLQQFGIGIGAMFTGLGAVLKLKENTEPKP